MDDIERKRRAYEWSILWYTMDRNGDYEDSDPEFADELKDLFGYFGENIPFAKEKRFTKVNLNEVLANGKNAFGNLEIKCWRWDSSLGEWDNDYAQIEDKTGKILPSDYYGWKVPKKYQLELNKFLQGGK
jgi:hypothetical protein